MHIKAIDKLILIISLNIKVKLTNTEQNNSYLLLIKLREINTPRPTKYSIPLIKSSLLYKQAALILKPSLYRLKHLIM
jgi:hypothetical protein